MLNIYEDSGLAPGVESDDGIPQEFPVKVGINLCGQDGFMSQHFLYSPQVSTPVNQFCGKGMTEGMRTDILLYACGCDKILYQGKHHHP